MTMSNLLSTTVIVSILVSVCSHKHRADYTTVHYIVQHATLYKQEVPNGPFSHRWSHIMVLKMVNVQLVNCVSFISVCV